MTRTSPSLNRLGPGWTVDDAADLYQIGAWGAGYFSVTPDGTVAVKPDPNEAPNIDILEVVEELEKRGHTAPMLLRFPDILGHRLATLREAFERAIEENEFRGEYAGVYPIKVNQERAVVQEVFRHADRHGCGLEVGSKPELLAIMALTDVAPDRLIVCNGFKDRSYIETVILATKLGRNIIPVVEKASELPMILQCAREHGVCPQIGVRVKLASQGAGRWHQSSGERSKFGLFVSELLEQFELLRSQGLEGCLTLLHCHAGSQLQDIRRVKNAVGELAHVYAELVRLGTGLRYLDVGGGLGVDYDGSRTNYSSSMNYSTVEYANEIVYRIGSVCDEKEIPHPTIVTESGRAVAAYQSVLVFNVLGSTTLDRFDLGSPRDLALREDDDTPQPIRDLFDAHESITERRMIECYHDACQAREGAQQLFSLGYLSLELRGLADRLFWATCSRIHELADRLTEIPAELENLESSLNDTYFCNFSIFQSLPDSWAIGQLFPIMPIHRLKEEPKHRGVLADITCDSDGHIDKFVDVRDIKRSLPLHAITTDEPYYLAAFLTGAYQETLADLHNLFGETHAANISLDENGRWRIDEIVKGDTSAEALTYVRYDPTALAPRIARDCDRAVAAGRMTPEDGRNIQKFYAAQLHGYTYITPDV